MAINTCTITDKIFEADGSIPPFARLRFELIGWDSDQNESGTPVVAPVIEFATVDDLTGEFSITLWQNGAGLRGTHYTVILERYTDINRTSRANPDVNLGKIQIDDGTTSADLTTLLSEAVTTSFVWYSAITQAEYDQILYLGINEQTADYTLTLTDASKMVEMNVGSANTLTVPDNATVEFPIGTQIIITQTGSGQTTITGAAGVTVNASVGLKLAYQWSVAALVKRATDSWILTGEVTA